MTAGQEDIFVVGSDPVNPEAFISRVSKDDGGAVVSFIGKVRKSSNGKRVLSLEHSAPKAVAERLLHNIAGSIRQRWPVRVIAFHYRTGPVKAGEVTVVIAVTAVHRQEAFAACQYAIDRFKESVSSREILEEGEG